MNWKSVAVSFLFLGAGLAVYKAILLYPDAQPASFLVAFVIVVGAVVLIFGLIRSADRDESKLQPTATPDPKVEEQDSGASSDGALELTDKDSRRIDELVASSGREVSRTEVISDAVCLFHLAFVTHEADEVVVMQNGEVVGRYRRAKSDPPN